MFTDWYFFKTFIPDHSGLLLGWKLSGGASCTQVLAVRGFQVPLELSFGNSCMLRRQNTGYSWGRRERERAASWLLVYKNLILWLPHSPLAQALETALWPQAAPTKLKFSKGRRAEAWPRHTSGSEGQTRVRLESENRQYTGNKQGRKWETRNGRKWATMRW